MNWGELMSLYTGSMIKYVNWARLKDIKYHTNERDLFDFFDEQGIYISISGRVGGMKVPQWYWLISTDKDHPTSNYYPTRQEAEEQAFTKAFELLEEKLNGGK